VNLIETVGKKKRENPLRRKAKGKVALIVKGEKRKGDLFVSGWVT